MAVNKNYRELVTLKTFEERLEYLKCVKRIGEETFGWRRYLNQVLYKIPEWDVARRDTIIRDNGLDLGIPGYDIIGEPIYIHHIQPLTYEMIVNRDPLIFSLDNLICCTDQTHKAIHYGAHPIIREDYIPRTPYDTSPWRKK